MSKLFYHVIFGDCRQELKRIPESSVHFVLTSPPYAWELKYSDDRLQMGNILNTREFFRELTKVWKLCYKALVPGGYMAVVWTDIEDARKLYGKTMIEPLVDYMIQSMKVAGFDLVSEWIWRKYEVGAVTRMRPFLQWQQMVTGYYIPKSAHNWEYVFVWRKPSGNLLPVFDVTDQEWYPEWLDGIWNIYYGPEDKETACFPIELARRLIKIYTRPGYIVLDPFLGSGTTMRAALMLKRSCIGIEVDTKRWTEIRRKVNWGVQPLWGEVEWRLEGIEVSAGSSMQGEAHQL